MTVAGTTTSEATDVTVDANCGGAVGAIRYVDFTFARNNTTSADGAFTFMKIGLGDEIIESQQHPADKLRGDLRNDPPPWHRLSLGGVKNLNYPLENRFTVLQ